MDYFYVKQVCSHCLRGTKIFRVDLSLYNDQTGQLNQVVQKMDCYSFVCHFCWRKCILDFYRFSHPDLILHLKYLHSSYRNLQNHVKTLDEIVNNLRKILSKLIDKEEEKEKEEDEKEKEEEEEEYW